MQLAATDVHTCGAGSGKTALVSELARTTGNMDCITVHIDDQMDAKSMLGAYVCTAVPGEFVWRPGPLMQVLRLSLAASYTLSFRATVRLGTGTLVCGPVK